MKSLSLPIRRGTAAEEIIEAHAKRLDSVSKPKSKTNDDGYQIREVRSHSVSANSHELQAQRTGSASDLENGAPREYKLYKRRWFGLVQISLLNIVVSWDWLTFTSISSTASTYFQVDVSFINWLTTSFLFAFLITAPVTMWILHGNGGPRSSIIAASVLLLAGNWIRYGGTKVGNLAAVGIGQTLCGLAQPFALAAPTRYSDLWFSNRGRITTTAIMSLANPLGGAIGSLVSPFMATDPSDVPNMVLYISIISSVACIPSFFIPAKPPTPVSASSTEPKLPLWASVKHTMSTLEFWLIVLPFWLFTGLLNATSGLINQIMQPFGFSEQDAGIAGALLIAAGVVIAAITSPIVDRIKCYLPALKMQVPILASCYLILIFLPPTGSLAALYVVLSVIGAVSFSSVPIILEFVVEVTHPVSPEITSVIAWTGGQVLGGLFIIIEAALVDGPDGGPGGATPFNMERGLWFQGILALCVMPLPLSLGLCGRRKKVALRRVEADRMAAAALAASRSVIVTSNNPSDDTHVITEEVRA